MVIIEAKELRTWFPLSGGVLGRTVGHVHAVDGVDITVNDQEIVSVVGESGCGKSTLGQSLVGLLPITSGAIALNGRRLDISRPNSWDPFRKDFQIIFQDPFTSLNPRHTILRILSEPLRIHRICKAREERKQCAQLLQKVGLSPEYLDRFPHEFSGGQRQRIAIARTIGLKPRAIICDEVVSALDVSVQAQIINLLLSLKKEMGMSLVFITHDLSLVKAISDRVYVMYLGKIMETAKTADLFSRPRHPYTEALLAAIPTLDRTLRPKMLAGDVPSPVDVPQGCVFQGRCPYAKAECGAMHPDIRSAGASSVACYFPLKYEND